MFRIKNYNNVLRKAQQEILYGVLQKCVIDVDVWCE